MKIVLQTTQNTIFLYMCKKVANIASVPFVMKISLNKKQNAFFGYMSEKLQKALWYRQS